MRSFFLYGVAAAHLVASSAIVSQAHDRSNACASFNLPSSVEDVTLLESRYYAKGDLVNTAEDGEIIEQTLISDDLPAFCRIRLTIHTDRSANGESYTEVWLPDDFNGDLLSLGLGGVSGQVPFTDLGFLGVGQKFAAVGTNGGHNGTALDSSYALNNEAARIDYGGRAMHLSTITAKELAAQYYGQPIASSLYAGCSQGGRMGMNAAANFPSDYDGIIAGAPAVFISDLFASYIKYRSYYLPVGGPSWISPDLWRVVHQEVLQQCDKAIDGVEDGIIQNPFDCRFRPEAIACRPNDDDTTCLQPEQIYAIKQTFSDWYEKNQTFVYSGLNYGAEVRLSTAGPLAPSDIILELPRQFFQYQIYNTSEFLNSTEIPLTLEAIEMARAITLYGLNEPKIDVSRFLSRGGKLLSYHGTSDELIPLGTSIRLYNDIELSLKSNSNFTKMDDFYRLFPVAGMGHCNSGPGANVFGGSYQSQMTVDQRPFTSDPKENVVGALREWVKNEQAPDQLIASHYVNNNYTNGVGFSRTHCRYPYVAKWDGKGDTQKADSWYCTKAGPF